MQVLSLRTWATRGLDVLAVAVVLAAVVRFLVLPHLHREIVQAPPVSVATLEGGRYDLGRHRGKVVFLDFWATWCDPCRSSIPLVQHFARTHRDVDVVSIDVGEIPATVRPFAQQFRMSDVALDPDATVAHAFGITGFPTLYAIGGDGRVLARWIGFDPDVEREMSNVLPRAARAKTAGV